MNHKNTIDVNPEILSWARNEMRADIEDVALQLNIDPLTYMEWEKSGTNIPFSSLKALAKTYKRQISCFFLPTVPQKTKKPTDHRNLNVFDPRLSSSTYLAMRRANRYQKVLLELNNTDYYHKKYKWIDEYNSIFKDKKIDKENIANWIREYLNISIEDQIKAKTPSEFYNLLRLQIEEKLGIAVFQFKMPKNEIQGFCYADEKPYCIVVNSDHHSLTGKTFTLIHELGHILKHTSSICYPDSNLNENQKIEFECNAFAGDFLLPVNAVTSIKTTDMIYIKARKMKISSEVYLRRMKSLDMLSDREFFKLLAEIRSKVVEPRKGFAILSQAQKSINSRGQHLFNTVVDASRHSRISYSYASDILGLKINHFASI